MPKKALFLAGCALLAGAFVVAAIIQSKRIATEYACLIGEKSAWCYIEESDRLAKGKGIEEALAYVVNTVALETNYKVAHMAMHLVGHAAYMRTHDVTSALAFLPPIDPQASNFLAYNGFEHGVFEQFFHEHGGSPPALMKEACAPYLSIVSPDATSSVEARILAPECFHALGHALMFTDGNDVPMSLKTCDSLEKTWMRQWCYHGVFMENYYLYIPGYLPDAPKPYAHAESLLPLCNKLESRYLHECALFLPWIYLEAHQGDFSGAFKECDSLNATDRRICVARAGRFYVPAFSRGDFSKMQSTCALAKDNATTCLYAAAIGVREGLAGGQNKGRSLCDALDPSLRPGCTEAVRRANESLARIYVSEI